MLQRTLASIWILAFVSGVLPALRADELSDKFVGTWKTKTKFAGYDQVLIIRNDGGQWSITGTFESNGAVVGTFLGPHVRFAGGRLTYLSKFVKKPVDSWQDNDTTLRLEGDALIMSFVAKTGDNIVRAFQRQPDERAPAAKTVMTERAKPTAPAKPEEKPGTAKLGAGAAGPKTAAKRFESQLTQENFERITKGMTKDEVLAILGANRSSASQGSSMRLGWYFSGDAAHKAEVQFADGKVVSKHSSIDWSKHGGKPAAVASATETKPEDKPAKEDKPPVLEDKLAGAITALKSGTAGQKRKALAFLAKASRDEERAAEASRLIQKCLSDKDEFVKLAARGAIEPWATRENSAYFIKIIEHHNRSDKRKPDSGDQDFALKILIKIRDPDSVAPIAKMLERFFDRNAAAEALLALGPELAQAEVTKYANHRDPNVALAARRILDQFKTSPALLLDRNLADLKSPVPNKRLSAALAIEKMDVDPRRRKEVALALEPLLADKQAWSAHAAAAALGKWGVPENEIALIRALEHTSPDMRRLAANALKIVGTQRSLPALQALVTKGDPLHPETAQAANAAMAAIKTPQRN
jgi:HEAT repeat protein